LKEFPQFHLSAHFQYIFLSDDLTTSQISRILERIVAEMKMARHVVKNPKLRAPPGPR